MSEDGYFEQFWRLQKPRIDFAVGCGSEILKNIQHIINKHRVADTGGDNELRAIETSIIEKAQHAGEVRNTTSAHSLVLVGHIYYLGMLTLWVSMNGSFDFEKALRSSIEICFDVREDLRCSDEMHFIIPKYLESQ